MPPCLSRRAHNETEVLTTSERQVLCLRTFFLYGRGLDTPGSLMPREPKSPREIAARALCRMEGHSEDILFEGLPMWQSFLAHVDAVLEAALSVEEWERMKAEGPQ